MWIARVGTSKCGVRNSCWHEHCLSKWYEGDGEFGVPVPFTVLRHGSDQPDEQAMLVQWNNDRHKFNVLVPAVPLGILWNINMRHSVKFFTK